MNYFFPKPPQPPQDPDIESFLPRSLRNSDPYSGPPTILFTERPTSPPVSSDTNIPNIWVTPPTPEASTSAIPDSPTSSTGTITPTNKEFLEDRDLYFRDEN